MRTISALLALLAIAALALATDAFAQSAICGPLESIIEAAGDQDLTWTGVVSTSETPVRVMLFQSQSGAWTLVAAQGITGCLVGFGTNGEAVTSGVPI